MLNTIKFELNILKKEIITFTIKRKAIDRGEYKELIGNSKLMHKYDIYNCGAVYMDGSIYILWEEEFYNKLNEKERLYCRLHELGHFNGYTTLSQLFKNERSLDEEVKADSNAVNKMGYQDVIESMTNILNYIEECQKPEMQQRINIQNMMFKTSQYVKKYSAQ